MISTKLFIVLTYVFFLNSHCKGHCKFHSNIPYYSAQPQPVDTIFQVVQPVKSVQPGECDQQIVPAQGVQPVFNFQGEQPMQYIKPVVNAQGSQPMHYTQPIVTAQRFQPMQYFEPVVTIRGVQPMQYAQPIVTAHRIQSMKHAQPIVTAQRFQPMQYVQSMVTAQGIQPMQYVQPVATAQSVQQVQNFQPVVTGRRVQPVEYDQQAVTTQDVQPAEYVQRILTAQDVQPGFAAQVVQPIEYSLSVVPVQMVKQTYNDGNPCEVGFSNMRETQVSKSVEISKVECDANNKYYKLDGTCNNLQFPKTGIYNTTYSRILPSAYSDGIHAPRMANDNSPLPGARQVRLAVFPNGNKLDTTRSLVTMQWGQIITHDMSFRMDGKDGLCCTPDANFQNDLSKFCMPIGIHSDDPSLGKKMSCMNFTRTMTDKDLGICENAHSPAQQINKVTPWMDLSVVYDVDVARHEKLRAKVDGLMKMDTRRGQTYPSHNPNGAANSCKCNRARETVCYLGGDERINQSPHLIVLQIMLLREHNRIATELKEINPSWNDERLYQEARRINIAQYQYISYYEWLPSILGKRDLINSGIIFPQSKCYVKDYDFNISPNVYNEFAHAAFRHFHSQIVGYLELMDSNRNTLSSISINKYLHRPAIIEYKNNLAQLSRGLLSQPAEDADEINVYQVTENMFACNSTDYGFDLRAFDIQRDRDHSIRYYNDYRKYCGLPKATCFDDFKDYIPQSSIDELKILYKSHNDVDLMVGGSLEKKLKRSLVGPTFQCILKKQFKKTRRADRLWFEHEEAGFTIDQLMELKKSSMSRIFCDNERGINKVQRNAFLSVKPNSGDLVECSALPVVDLTKWKE